MSEGPEEASGTGGRKGGSKQSVPEGYDICGVGDGYPSLLFVYVLDVPRIDNQKSAD